MLVVLVLWPLAAFGGGEIRTALPFGILCLAAAALVRPSIGSGQWRDVDRAMIALLALMCLQALPLPAALSRVLSPNVADVRAAISLSPVSTSGLEPLSIRPAATAWAALVAAAAGAIFWIARRLFEAGGVRRVVRATCTIGMAVSLLAIAQAATAGRRIYWMFPTDHEGPLPFGPFVNRNHFATWVIMAAPLCFGYIAARSSPRAVGQASPVPARWRLTRIDGRTVWLTACGAAMIVALLLSLSRSGIVALGTAGALTILLTRRRADASRRWWFMTTVTAAVVVAAFWSDLGAVVERLAAASTAVEGRLRIWRETVPIIADFWLTGTGAGTYQTAMLLYQHSDRLWYFNQAHNHYLQIAAEGGLLLSLPALAALGAALRHAVRRAREDRSGIFWIRSGALCGLGAAGLQSLWETGLTMPANAALAAVLAALAVHARTDDLRA